MDREHVVPHPQVLERAGEVFLTNTTGGVIAVREVRGLEAGPLTLPGTAGPLAAAAYLNTASNR